MPTELISKDEAVKAIETYAHVMIDEASPKEAKVAFECLRIVRNIPAYGAETAEAHDR